MDFAFGIMVAIIPLALPFMAGYIARRFGRSFWFWFLLSIPLPLISCFIVVCLPDKSLPQMPVESQDIFKELNGIQ